MQSVACDLGGHRSTCWKCASDILCRGKRIMNIRLANTPIRNIWRAHVYTTFSSSWTSWICFVIHCWMVLRLYQAIVTIVLSDKPSSWNSVIRPPRDFYCELFVYSEIFWRGLKIFKRRLNNYSGIFWEEYFCPNITP